MKVSALEYKHVQGKKVREKDANASPAVPSFPHRGSETAGTATTTKAKLQRLSAVGKSLCLVPRFRKKPDQF